MARRNRRNAKPQPRRRAPRRQRGGRGDAAALRGIKQGVGKSVRNAFATQIVTRKYHPNCHDAFHYCHLPLPRAIGPYTVVRTTQMDQLDGRLMIFGPVYNPDKGRWTDLGCLEFHNLGNALVGGAGQVTAHQFHAIRNNNSWQGAQIAPAAFSVQVMNPGALQTTSGIVYIGRIRTSLKLSADLTTKVQDLCDQLISYNNPRLCSAAKLAFRGVQIDLVPFNMAELANFTLPSADSFTQYGAASPDPKGFAPAFVYNPGGLSLQFLYCCEWRVRFDPSNPAQATHVHHPPASESVWAQAQRFAEEVGNGVIDIADKVANTGMAIGRAYQVGRGLRALGAGQLALGM